MNIKKLIEMGGKEWKAGDLVQDDNGDIQGSDGDKYSRVNIKHRFYFNDRDDLLEEAGVSAYGQDFYYDVVNGSWAGDLCGYEIDKMNEYYK